MRIRRWDPTEQSEGEAPRRPRRPLVSTETRRAVRVYLRRSGWQLQSMLLWRATGLVFTLAVRRLFDRPSPPDKPRRRR